MRKKLVITYGMRWARLGLEEQPLWLFSLTASSLPSQVLRLMVGVQVTDEQLESITDRTVQEADEDGDGAVSFLEFTKVRRG